MKKIINFVIGFLIFELTFFAFLMINNGNNNFSSVDSAHYSSAIEKIDFANEQPHLPGYILYIKSLQIINSLLDNLNSNDFNSNYYSIVYLTAFLTSISLVMLYFLFNRFLNWKISLLLVITIFSLPQILYYGSNAENYSLDFFFMTLFLLIITDPKKYHWGLLIIAIASGFRQSFIMFTLPIYIFKYFDFNELKKAKFNSLVFTILFLILILTLTFYYSGGILNYIDLYSKVNPIPNSNIFTNIIGLISFNITLIIAISILILPKLNQNIKILYSDKLNLQLLNYIFLGFVIFIIHYNKGYSLVLIPIIFYFVSKLMMANQINYFQLLIVILINLLVFFAPTYKFPSAETNIPNLLRTKSSFEIYKSRLFGNYLQNYNLIQNNAKNINEMKALIIKVNSEDSISCFRIFPSCQIDPKIIQEVIKLKDNHFKSIYLDDTGKFSYLINSEFNDLKKDKYGIILTEDLMSYISLDMRNFKTQKYGKYICKIIDLQFK